MADMERETQRQLEDQVNSQTNQLHNGKKVPSKENTLFFKGGLTLFLASSSTIAFFFLLYRFTGFKHLWGSIFNAIQPIIIGMILAYLINPVFKRLNNLLYSGLSKKMKDEAKAKKLSKGLAVTLSIVILIGIIALLLAAVVPALVTSVYELVATLPKDVEEFIVKVQQGELGDSPIAKLATEQLKNLTDYVENWAQTKLLPEAQTYISQITSGVISVVKGVMNFIIGIIVTVYVLSIKDTLIGQSKKILFAISKPKTANYVVEVMRKANSIFGGFISGKIIDSMIIGLICYIGCLILRIPDAMLIAVIIGVTNIIPVFGPFIGAIPSILLVCIQSPWHALYLLIFIIILQQVDGNIIGPKILGESTGLSSFWVMFAILIGGGLFGFAGMILGVPTFALFYYLVRRAINHTARKKNLPETTMDYVNASGVDITTGQLRYDPIEEKKPEKKESKETLKDNIKKDIKEKIKEKKEN